MKYVFLLFLFVSGSLFAQTGIEIFGKYKIPDVEYSVFSLNLNSSGNSNSTNEPRLTSSRIIRPDIIAPVRINGQLERFSLTLSLSPIYNRIVENEAFQSHLQIGTDADLRYFENSDQGTYYDDYKYRSYPTRSITRQSYINPIVSYEFKNYGNVESNNFTYMNAHADLGFEFYRYNTVTTPPFPTFPSNLYDDFQNIYSDSKKQNYTVGLGVGTGKLRDVTSVITALRFEERLKRVNLLMGQLTDDQINSIAQQFSLFSFYNATYDRPGKYFWDDMRKILDGFEINLSQSTLHSQYYIFESVNELKFRRIEGSSLKAGLDFNYRKSEMRDYISSNYLKYSNNPPRYYTAISKQSTESIFPGIELNAQVSSQLSLFSQFGYGINFASHVNISEIKNSVNYHQLSGFLKFDHEITDQFVFTFSNNIDFINTNFTYGHINILSNQFKNKFIFFIEDQLGIQFDYNFIYRQTTGEYAIRSDYFFRDHTYFIGLTYFFDKSLIIN